MLLTFLLKWQYKQNRRRHLHNLGILWIDKALSCQLKTLAWQYLWWKVVPGYKEREFSLIKDFQILNTIPFRARGLVLLFQNSLTTVWIQLSGERQGISSQDTNTRTCTSVQTDFREYGWEDWWVGTGRTWGLKGERSRDISTVVWLTPSWRCNNSIEEAFSRAGTKLYYLKVQTQYVTLEGDGES